MKQPIHGPIATLVAAFCALALTLPAAPAFATKLVGNSISGTVTSLANGHLLVVDGKSYSVPVTGPAMAQLRQLRVGETVDLVLSGPASSASTTVLAIHVHNGS